MNPSRLDGVVVPLDALAGANPTQAPGGTPDAPARAPYRSAAPYAALVSALDQVKLAGVRQSRSRRERAREDPAPCASPHRDPTGVDGRHPRCSCLIFFFSTRSSRRARRSDSAAGARAGGALLQGRAIRVWVGPRGEVALNDASVPMNLVDGPPRKKAGGDPGLNIALYADARGPLCHGGPRAGRSGSARTRRA